jgi:vacuolar protein sorting-associated protein 35
MSDLNSEEPQLTDKQIFDEASGKVKKQGFFMKKELDSGNVKAALKHAALMIFELKTGKLSPQNYYDLYISVTDELRYLKASLQDEVKRPGKKSYDLYEVVQYSGNILPRLYLLITVGAIYIEAGLASPMKVLVDLVELCKGVQHPTRGLFLRSYLSQLAKDLLPDMGSDYYKEASDVEDSIKFIIQNFTEVNRLWVRMQHQGPVRDRARREQERQNLRMLVGTNLVRLSQLEGVKIDIYENTVLPRLLELIIECKDKIAQEYLMDVIIQVFPDEYHLKTLEKFLNALSDLNETVNLKQIIISLMNRLSNFALQNPQGIPANMEMFPLFQKCASKVLQDKKDSLTVEDILSLQLALINFASKVYPERLNYLDHVLEFTAAILKMKTSPGQLNDKSSKIVLQLLTVPLNSLGMKVFTLGHYVDVINFLAYEYRRQVGSSVAKAVLNSNSKISSLENLDILFSFISSLIKDAQDTAPVTESNRYEFEEEQYLVARLVHTFYSEDTDEHFALLFQARNVLSEGGDSRLKFVLPSLIFAAMNMMDRNFQRESSQDAEQKVKTKKILQYIHKGVSHLSPLDPKMSIRLYLQACILSDKYGYEPITYEFLTQAFVVYEEELADSKDLTAAINLIVGTIQRLRNLSTENYESISSNASQHSGKLLKKPEKTRAVYNCAYMFWTGTEEAPGVKEGKMVQVCLQRALKNANTVIEATEKTGLFVELLDQYLYFYEKGVEQITDENLRNLLELIEGQLATLEANAAGDAVKSHFQRTVQHIKIRKKDPNSRCSQL